MKTEQEEVNEQCEELLHSLPKVRNWAGTYLCLYQGVWCEPQLFHSLLFFQKHFKAQDSDIVLATFPKSGTTWLKALTFSITTRTLHSPLLTNSPLLSSSPHTLVPFIAARTSDTAAFLNDLPTPRTFSTHVPYKLLPTSVHDSKCRIIYLCRNPLDQFISHYHFFQKLTNFAGTDTAPTVNLSEAFDVFCEGNQMMGPVWDHVLGYWKMSLERPEEVMFLRFEDLKKDTAGCTKKMAEFLGCPFTAEEEARGGIQDIVMLCSFDTLKELEVNKSGEMIQGVKNEYFYRKGAVGDWANYLSPEMVKRAESIMKEKLAGSGLAFSFDSNEV